MSEREESATGLELLLEEPEIVAWLNDYRSLPEDVEDDEPPAAA